MDLLRHLQFFTAVADERHFGRAAEVLGITQPPLSQGIRRLEERWGVRLFDRNARAVTLTAVGAGLVPAARLLLSEAAALEGEVAGLAAGRAPLRVVTVADLGAWTAPLLTALADDAGDREVAPTLAATSRAVELLLAGQADLAVVRHPSVLDGVEAGAVLALPRRLCLPAGTDVGATDLGRLDLPLVVPPRSDHPAAHDQDVDLLRRAGHSGRTTVVRDPAAAVALVAAGRGCLLLTGDRAPEPLTGLRLPGLDLLVRVVRRRFAPEAARLDGHAAVLEGVLAGAGAGAGAGPVAR